MTASSPGGLFLGAEKGAPRRMRSTGIYVLIPFSAFLFRALFRSCNHFVGDYGVLVYDSFGVKPPLSGVLTDVVVENR